MQFRSLLRDSNEFTLSEKVLSTDEDRHTLIQVVDQKNQTTLIRADTKLTNVFDKQDLMIHQLIHFPVVVAELSCLSKSDEGKKFVYYKSTAEKKLSSVVDRFLAGENVEGYNPTARLKIIYGVASFFRLLEILNISTIKFSINDIFIDSNLEPKIIGLHNFFPVDFKDQIDILSVELSEQDSSNSLAPAELTNGENNHFSTAILSFFFGMIIYQMYNKETNRFVDNPREINGAFKCFMAMKNGAVLVKGEKMPEQLYELYKMCFDFEPENRPRFDEILKVLENENFLENVDRTSFNEYKARLDSSNPILVYHSAFDQELDDEQFLDLPILVFK
ncbi:hypothetical protein TRFO_30058 [Tritrichomonas foetus]|uniref:Serine-threonine/tyrosine-protein kinase catalytic domain-containing protein n=1 Tax=Tritrichomonas foetus TaxID=1144522 RepID=A0A1J4JUS1_9EUKA|nr:hypothetical protein TRFO_30058 [Tritrichomonas foetus]|eukprot:OHT02747.1 hypothetical protein TRFO_30058 [Tritrichomonas foetus]